MIFEQIKTGGDRNFAYLIGDETTKKAAVADPANHPQKVLSRAAKLGLEVVYLINTHGHFDHTSGNEMVQAKARVELIRGGPSGAGDGAVFSLGEVELKVIHTPGHTQDSICVLATAPGVPGKLVTGDTLFVGKVGGTGFGQDARDEYESIHSKLLTLPEETEVWPGHDYGVAPRSTIGHEKKTNPFILRERFEDFLWLKKNWAAYKEEHGIA
jgi:glyoxylase-like metal-dependent hydrolase (beta-lactamase superfamily II)